MENAVKQKSFDFTLRIVNVSKFLQQKQEYILSKQLLRSGTAVGALIREAEHGESRADFIHKLSIAQKEANESQYWLELLNQSDYIDAKSYKSLNTDCTELLKLLTAIIKTTKGV